MVVRRLEVADGYWSRLIGWQWRRRPEVGHGLLLVPCASVHTFWLRFPLDLVSLDCHGQVLAVRKGVRPWRIPLPTRQAHAILELPSGESQVQPEEKLRILGPAGKPFPKSLQFLRY
jgi:uncharacterized protein